MTRRLTPLACALLLSTAAYAAPDQLYRIESADFQAYSGAILPTTVTAPDGSKVHELQAPSDNLGNFGPPGFSKDGIKTGLYVQPNQLEEWSVFYRWLGGDNNARLCVDKVPLSTTSHSCIYFNGQTGDITSPADPFIVRYSIAPIATGWLYASMTFQTAPSIPANTQVFVYVQTRFDQTLAVWKGRFVTGQAP